MDKEKLRILPHGWKELKQLHWQVEFESREENFVMAGWEMPVQFVPDLLLVLQPQH